VGEEKAGGRCFGEGVAGEVFAGAKMPCGNVVGATLPRDALR